MRTWDPFSDLDAIRRELDRALHNYAAGREPRWQYAFLPGQSARAYPLINLSQDRDNVYVEALSPGVNPESLDLSVVNNTLTIAWEKMAPANVPFEAFHRSERAAGKFVRSVELPVQVNSANVSARYADGLLTVTLPKAEEAKPRQISVAVQ